MGQEHSTWDTVWITGASSGIGKALAALMADRGKANYIAVSARSADKLAALGGAARPIHAHPVDVTDEPAVVSCVKDIEAAAGAIDLAVLCAGTWKLTHAAELDTADARAGMEVNYMGAIHAILALLPGMKQRGSGHIAIVASVAGFRGLPLSAAYGPTKAALINLAETLHAELRPHGIMISVVNPGFVDTPMTKDNPFPMPGIIQPDEAAKSLLAGLERRKYEIIFPRVFAYSVKALRLLPNALFFWLVRTFMLDETKRASRSA